MAIEDHHAVLVLAPTLAGGYLLQGSALPDHLVAEVVVRAHFTAASSEKPRRTMASYSAGRPDSTFGLTSRAEVGEDSAMRTPELRERWLIGVSWGSGFTGRREGEPDERPDEEEIGRAHV